MAADDRVRLETSVTGYRVQVECAHYRERLHAASCTTLLCAMPDAGDPHVRFDERGLETGTIKGLPRQSSTLLALPMGFEAVLRP